MDIETARQLRIGDPVEATTDGLSHGVSYSKGQRGIVAFKAGTTGAFFAVHLEGGERTGIVSNWKWQPAAGAKKQTDG